MTVFMKVNIFTNLKSLLIVQLDYGCGLREPKRKEPRKKHKKNIDLSSPTTKHLKLFLNNYNSSKSNNNNNNV